MKRHPTGCDCCGVVERATDAKIRAQGDQIKAIWLARRHGASLRQIAAAAGLSADHVRQICAVDDGSPIELPPAVRPQMVERRTVGIGDHKIDAHDEHYEPPAGSPTPGPYNGIPVGGLLG